MGSQNIQLRTLPLYAVPTAQQLDKWHSLSREEQELSVSKSLSDALCSEPVELDSETIKKEALERHGIVVDET